MLYIVCFKRASPISEQILEDAITKGRERRLLNK